MKNLTDFCKEVEIDVDRRLVTTVQNRHYTPTS